MLATTAIYLWNITVNAMANPFYAGATWAGTRNWEALLFGAVDPSNFITVDKPPVSQWIMGLSGRIFGFSSASMLVPQALLGIASVWLVYSIGARVAGRWAGLLAGAALAITPVATMMFRFNNPDAAMVFFMTLGAWCTVHAAQKASWRWLALAGVAMGFAFLAKMLEGLMSLPALALLYLMAAPTRWVRKVVHLLGAALALVVSSGWYVLLTILWPARSRPYLAGSTDNSFLNLVFGYNGLARVAGKSGRDHADGSTSRSTAAASSFADAMRARGTQGGFGGFGSAAGPTRLFTGEFGLEISWLIPAAMVGLAAVLWLTRRHPRTDLLRATSVMAGTWLLLDGAVLSFMNGTTHAYYTLAIAPAIALCFGLGVVTAWQHHGIAGRFWLAAVVAVAGGWGSWLLLGVATGWHPWIGWTVAALTVAIVVGIISVPAVASRMRSPRAIAVVAAAVAVTTLGAPASIAVNSVDVSHTGGSPTVMPSGTRTEKSTRSEWGATTGGFRQGSTQLNNPALVKLLQSSEATWAAATAGTESAATLELAARVPVMGVGGFTGSDPTPSLAQFQADVKARKVGYYVVTGSSFGDLGDWPGRQTNGTSDVASAWAGMRGGSSSVQGQILTWVKANFTARTVGSATVYTLG